MIIFMIVLSIKYYWGYKIEADEISWVCGTYKEEQKCLRDMVGKPQGERNNLQDPGIDGGVILKLIFKKFDERTMTGTGHRQAAGVCELMNVRMHEMQLTVSFCLESAPRT
jgi:hypothetical protein